MKRNLLKLIGPRQSRIVGWKVACSPLRIFAQIISLPGHPTQCPPVRNLVSNNQTQRVCSIYTARCFIRQLIQQKVSDIASLSNKGIPCTPNAVGSVRPSAKFHPSLPPQPLTNNHTIEALSLIYILAL
jgi:hypothetical protein